MKMYPLFDEYPPAASLGCLPFTLKVASQFPEVGEIDEVPMMPEEEWMEYDLSDRVADHTYYQNGVPSCSGNAGAGLMRLEAKLAGIEKPPIYSAEGLQALSGAPANQGQEIGKIMETLIKIGVPTTEYVPLLRAAWDKRQWKQGWEENAAENRILEAYFGRSFEAAASMAQRGLGVEIGVIWTGGGGHAVYVCGMKRQSGQWGFLIKNSHGSSYGDNGVGWLPRSRCTAINYFGCYGIRSRRLNLVVPQPPTIATAV